MSKFDELTSLVNSTLVRRLDVGAGDLAAIEAEVEDLLASIGRKPDIGSAEPELCHLGHIQELLALLAFRFEIPLTEILSFLVREYDRFDDFGVRLAAFRECQRGEFWTTSQFPK